MKPTSKKVVEQTFRGLALLLSGAGIGWLVGLSVSPVVHIILTSVVALVVSVTSALAGLKIGENDEAAGSGSAKRNLRVEINPVPMTLVVVGLALGASLAVYARANNLLGPNATKFAEQWKDTGLDRKDLSRRLFDKLYPPQSNSSPAESIALAEDKPPDQSELATNETATNENDTQQPSGTTTTVATQKKDVFGQVQKNMNEKEELASSPGIPAQYFASVLFSSPSPSDCGRFLAARPERLNEYLTNYKDAKVVEAATSCNGNQTCLKALVTRLCVK